MWFPVVRSASASAVLQALQLSNSEVSASTWLEDGFSPWGHEVCAMSASSPGDLSS